uniref:Ras-related protein Rab-3C n=1 Tax=Schistosoma haematobium TaxID=6185 RepID=A0A095A650_SCHHA
MTIGRKALGERGKIFEEVKFQSTMPSICVVHQIAAWFDVLPRHKQDTAGQERYRTITTAYYRGAMGFILMYDITNEESFNAVQDWVTQIKTYSWDNAQVVLVGNKCDLVDDRVVSVDRGRHLAHQLGNRLTDKPQQQQQNQQGQCQC